MDGRSTGADSLTLRQRIKYWFDNSLTRGVWSVIVLTAVALTLVVLIVAGILWLARLGPEDHEVPFPEAVWLSLTRSLDAGTVGPDEGSWFRAAGITVTLFGLLAVAVTIGLITSAVERRVFELRRGRSMVAEKDHTLILGYSPMLPTVVNEILEATCDERHHAVVVLTRMDTVDIEDAIKRARAYLDTGSGRTSARKAKKRWNRVVVRRGTPSSVSDLTKVRAHAARAVIVLRPEISGNDADAEVVKASLAVMKTRGRGSKQPIVAELTDSSIATALREASTEPGRATPAVTCVLSTDVVAQIAAQTSRAAGLGSVYQELLDFSGDEFHFHTVKEGAPFETFGGSLAYFPRATPVGVLHPDGSSDLCPDLGMAVVAGDRLIVIAEDDKSVDTGTRPISTELVIAGRNSPAQPEPQRLLLVGWNRVAPSMVQEIDRQAPPHSTLVVFTDEEIGESMGSFKVWTPNLTIDPVTGSTIDRTDIERVLEGDPFDHIVVLCSHSAISPAVSDARTLLSLLHLRHVLDEKGDRGRTNIVTEVLEEDAVDTARVAEPDDFIVSHRLVSLLLAQLAVAPQLEPVFQDLFDTKDTQVVVQPALAFGLADRSSPTFGDILLAAAPHGFITIGIERELRDDDGSLNRVVKVNPSKATQIPVDEHLSLIGLSRRNY